MGTKVYDNYADLITFNRNSKGTALRPIGYGDELVTNGTFDTDVSGWSSSSLGVVTWSSGAMQLEVLDGDIHGGASQSITTEVGKAYIASFDIISVSSEWYITLPGIAEAESATGTQSYVFVATSTSTSFAIYARSPDLVGSDTVVVDNVSVKEVLFDREDDPLTLFLHPEGVPRIEYDADRNLKGLLIEPDGENICLQSEDFSTTWIPFNATITTNDTTAPDGNATADLFSDDINNTAHRVSQSGLSVTSGQSYTFSVYAKYESRQYLQLTFNSAHFSATQYATFDLINGTVSGQADSTAQIIDIGNGWYRCIYTASCTVTTSSFAFLILSNSATGRDPVYVGDGSGVYIWGAQVEASPIVTSYMPTTISKFTRDNDDASMTNVSGLIGQKEGTLYVEVDWKSTSGTAQWLLSVNDGTANNRMIIYKAGGQLRMFANAGGGGSETDQGESSTAYSGIQKFAFAYADNDFELYRNGSSISTDTVGSLAALATLTDIDLGQSWYAGNQANMHIRAVQIIPRRLSDAQLIELTS